MNIAKKKDFSERNIRWVVVLAILFVTGGFTMFNSIAKIFFPSIIPVIIIIKAIVILWLFIFQYGHFGLNVKYKPFVLFFVIYTLYIYTYITVFQVYPLKQLYGAPTSVLDLIVKSLNILIYLLCAETIIKYFDIQKFLWLIIVIGLGSCLLYVFIVGVNYVQTYENAQDDKYIGPLTIGYSCMTIFVLIFFHYKRLCSNILIRHIVMIMTLFLLAYLIVICTKRGPILWLLVSIAICHFLTKKYKFGYLIAILFVLSLLYLYIDVVLDWMREISPATAYRIKQTLYDGDTAYRFDLKDKEESGYIIGIEQFLKSPIWGSYFRLITPSQLFQGLYPHNLFIEILITMGLMGFIPILFFIKKTYSNIRKIFSSNFSDNQFVILNIFLTSFLALQTTGTILFNTTFWLFFYLMCIMKDDESKRKDIYRVNKKRRLLVFRQQRY